MADPQTNAPSPPGWADGFSRAELERRAAFFRTQVTRPDLDQVERRAMEVCVMKYEEAIHGR